MKYLSLIIAFIVSGIALYFTLINVPLHQIYNYLISIDMKWIIISIVINYVSFILRAYRWQLIVKDIQPINFWDSYHPTAIAFMMNGILPGRIGELARPAILYQKKKVPISSGIATIVAERLFDIIVLIILYGFVFMYVNIDQNYQMEIWGYTLSKTVLTSLAAKFFFLFSILIVCILCINIDYVRLKVKKGLLFISQIFSFAGIRVKTFIRTKCLDVLIDIMDHVANGFSSLKSPGRIIHCFFLSLVIWFLVAVSYYVMSFGCKELNINFFEMCAVLVMICFFISLPSVPGYWGVWEAGGVFAMMIFGVGQKEAIGFTLVNHASQLFPIIIAGFISAFFTGTSIFTSIKKTAVEKNK